MSPARWPSLCARQILSLAQLSSFTRRSSLLVPWRSLLGTADPLLAAVLAGRNAVVKPAGLNLTRGGERQWGQTRRRGLGRSAAAWLGAAAGGIAAGWMTRTPDIVNGRVI